MNGPTTGYETRDARPKWLALWTFLLVLLVVLAFLVVRVLARSLDARRAASAEPAHPMADYRRPPATAQLQANPITDLTAYEAAQRERLSTYGWIDAERGVVRLPIERAMELLLERGLPARAEPGGER